MAGRVGQQFGNYRLIQLLGSGGFAEVYLAEHRQLGMKAAIKILHAHLASEEISAFRQEAKTIADLKHPHIIRVLDFDVQNGIPFLVLDYASKGSLRTLHPRGKKLPLDLVVTYVQQIASALQHAHEHKLIHRDVKPENVLIGEDDHLLLSDFGIATIAHSTSSMTTSATVGTLAYMAPEQIQGKPRPASDQYALAITVYYWLTGKLPFAGSSAEIIAQHLGAPPPSLRTHVPEIPAEVEQVVRTALAKDPQQRFGSMQAFAHALTIASGQAETASPLSHIPPLQAPKPASNVKTQQATRASVGSDLSRTPSVHPALMPPRSSSPTPQVPSQRSTHVSKRQRLITAIVISGLLLTVIGGSIFLVTKQRGGTNTSPYHLSALESGVQQIGLTVSGTYYGDPTDPSHPSLPSISPELTIVDADVEGDSVTFNLSWQGLDTSQTYTISSTNFCTSPKNNCLFSTEPAPPITSVSFDDGSGPQAGQKWRLQVSISPGKNTNIGYDYYVYFQF